MALDEPFRWSLLEGAKGVQLAELGLESWEKRAWVDVPDTVLMSHPGSAAGQCGAPSSSADGVPGLSFDH